MYEHVPVVAVRLSTVYIYMYMYVHAIVAKIKQEQNYVINVQIASNYCNFLNSTSMP